MAGGNKKVDFCIRYQTAMLLRPLYHECEGDLRRWNDWLVRGADDHDPVSDFLCYFSLLCWNAYSHRVNARPEKLRV